jgi:hypothetical protein
MIYEVKTFGIHDKTHYIMLVVPAGVLKQLHSAIIYYILAILMSRMEGGIPEPTKYMLLLRL